MTIHHKIVRLETHLILCRIPMNITEVEGMCPHEIQGEFLCHNALCSCARRDENAQLYGLINHYSPTHIDQCWEEKLAPAGHKWCLQIRRHFTWCGCFLRTSKEEQYKFDYLSFRTEEDSRPIKMSHLISHTLAILSSSKIVIVYENQSMSHYHYEYKKATMATVFMIVNPCLFERNWMQTVCTDSFQENRNVLFIF